MSKSETMTSEVPPVTYTKELRGERGEKIKEVMKRRAIRGEIMSYRSAILSLLDLGLEKELNLNK